MVKIRISLLFFGFFKESENDNEDIYEGNDKIKGGNIIFGVI